MLDTDVKLKLIKHSSTSSAVMYQFRNTVCDDVCAVQVGSSSGVMNGGHIGVSFTQP